MSRPNVRKKESLNEDETNAFTIVFTLINSKEPMYLSEIAKEIDLPANLVFYHIKILMDKSIVLETKDKKYDVQSFFKNNVVSENLDSLIFVMIKIIATELLKDSVNLTETELGKAVINNLDMYLHTFVLEIE